MELVFKNADKNDAEVLIDIYNSAFYSDYIKYGECPAYGLTKEMMEKSILNYPKFVILLDNKPVGCISSKKVEEDTYEVDLSFYFGEEAKINIPTSEKGRQFDAQYPTEEVLKKCCMMNDFGSQTEKVQDMFLRVKA